MVARFRALLPEYGKKKINADGVIFETKEDGTTPDDLDPKAEAFLRLLPGTWRELTPEGVARDQARVAGNIIQAPPPPDYSSRPSTDGVTGEAKVIRDVRNGIVSLLPRSLREKMPPPDAIPDEEEVDYLTRLAAKIQQPLEDVTAALVRHSLDGKDVPASVELTARDIEIMKLLKVQDGGDRPPRRARPPEEEEPLEDPIAEVPPEPKQPEEKPAAPEAPAPEPQPEPEPEEKPAGEEPKKLTGAAAKAAAAKAAREAAAKAGQE